MNFNLHFGELHSDSSINDSNTLFENYLPKCYKVKRILISFNCFSEYSIVTVCMIATAVVSVFLYTETDQNTRKTTIF